MFLATSVITLSTKRCLVVFVLISCGAVNLEEHKFPVVQVICQAMKENRHGINLFREMAQQSQIQ